jgi:transposase
MRTKAYQEKRQAILGKSVLGIDPGKLKHAGAVLDASGVQQGSNFRFEINREGFDQTLWKQVNKRLDATGPEDLVVAIETSCNLWKMTAHDFYTKGYQVLLVKPLITHHSRPLMKQDFSRTDPKDAFLIADNAQKGFYDAFQVFSPHIEAMHHLSITYDKLWKDSVKAKQRLRAFMEIYFPEYLNAFDIDTQTSLYLLEKYFLPHHFLTLDIEKEAPILEHISRRHHGRQTLLDLQAWAKASIGVPGQDQEEALRITLDAFLAQLKTTQDQLERVEKALVDLAQKDPTFPIIRSIPDINNNLTAQFIAETRGPARFDHFKQIEKLAGYNLRLSESGQYRGARHISGIGNPRLRRILFQMTQQAVKSVPQVRHRFLKRQLKHKRYRKNIVAASSQLLRLIVALIKANQPYHHKDDWKMSLAHLEQVYQKGKTSRPRPYRNSHLRRLQLIQKNHAA